MQYGELMPILCKKPYELEKRKQKFKSVRHQHEKTLLIYIVVKESSQSV